MIYKAGEIIPEISTVLKDKRTGKEEIFEMPKTCPICGEPVHRIEGEAAYRCTNPNCGGVVRESSFTLLPVMPWTSKGWDPRWWTVSWLPVWSMTW